MESAAMFVQGLNFKDYSTQDRQNALRGLCDYNSMLGTVTFKQGSMEYPLLHPSDDDYVRLMKFIPDDYYVQQWLSRTYDLVPLWKSVVECRLYFNDLWKDKAFVNYLKSEQCREFIVKTFGYDDYKVWLCDEIGPSDKVGKSTNINLFVNGKPKKFTDIFEEDSYKIAHTDKDFVYYFIPREGKMGVTNVDAVVEAIKGGYAELKKTVGE